MQACAIDSFPQNSFDNTVRSVVRSQLAYPIASKWRFSPGPKPVMKFQEHLGETLKPRNAYHDKPIMLSKPSYQSIFIPASSTPMRCKLHVTIPSKSRSSQAHPSHAGSGSLLKHFDVIYRGAVYLLD